MKTLYTIEELREQKIVINARTEEEDRRLRLWAHSQGLRWCSGDSYLGWGEYNSYDEHGSETCHMLYQGEYCSKEYYLRHGYQAITVPEFFMEAAEDVKKGDEVWMLDHNKVVADEIQGVAWADAGLFVYAFNACKGVGYGMTFTKTEPQLFPTKQDLIDSL